MPTESTPSRTDRPDDETFQLIREHQNDPDNEDVKSQLVDKYYNLVRSISRKFSRDRNIQDDLFQVGIIGLLGALKRFDPEVGRSFEAFAVVTIAGEIKRFIRDKTWSVHVPRRVKELGPKIKKVVDTLTNEQGRSPSVKEIANALDVDEEEVLETMELGRSYNAISVDSKMDGDAEGGTVTLLDLVGQQETGYEQINKKMILEKAFKVISEQEKQILIHTYFENLSQKETGELMGISQMHVSRLQRRALRKLRETLSGEETEVMK